MAVAIDKYTCPFCGQKAIFVGVHDDEGNYKGRPGCEYESDPWSGLCYAIHHDGWGDCILCTDAHDLPLGGCFFDTAEEAFQAIPTLTHPNEPLTLEELREINEEPIYVTTKNYGDGWCILNWHGVNKSYTYFSRTGTAEGMTATPLSAKTYGDLWLAYRRPPEEVLKDGSTTD